MNRLGSILISILLTVPLAMSAQVPGGRDSLSMVELDSLVFTDRSRGLVSPSGALMQLNLQSAAKMPGFLGQVDPLSIARTLPGVYANKESALGLVIQGCESSHSSVTVDGARIFCPDHLFGLFSPFISGHFSQARLIKSRTDASGGDFLGGSVDFVSGFRDGFEAEGNISLLSSEASMNVPLGESTTLHLSARTSYINMLYGKWLVVGGSVARYGFTDANLSLRHIISSRDTLVLSIYGNNDNISEGAEGESVNGFVKWNNGAASLSWKHASDNLHTQTSVMASGFGNKVILDGMKGAGSSSSILAAALQNNSSYKLRGASSLIFGGSLDFYSTSPFYLGSSPTHQMKAFGGAAYAGAILSLGEIFTLSPGIRLSTLDLKYFGLDPRINLDAQVSDDFSCGVHLGMSSQYLHKLLVLGGGLPIEFWTLSSESLAPQKSTSFSLYAEGRSGKLFSYSAEVYLRNMKNLSLMGVNPFDLLADVDLFDFIHEGSGRNYGLDLSLRKDEGRLKGSLAYSLARSERYFPTLSDKVFCSPFDRTHELDAVLIWRLGGPFSLSGNFTYISGTPYTGINRLYVLNGTVIPEYGDIYGSRMPEAHRLDLSFIWDIPVRRMRQASLYLSVYNVYGRKNVQYIIYSADSFTGKFVSYIDFPLPSISLYFKI